MRRRGLHRGAPEKSTDGRRGYGIVTASSSPLCALPLTTRAVEERLDAYVTALMGTLG